MNDRLRVIGIMAMEKHREQLSFLMSNRMTSRDQIDDPSKHPNTIFEKIAVDFNTFKIVVAHPVGAEVLQVFPDMDPNNKLRINIKRDSKFIRSVYNDTMRHYHKASEKWKSGTGGGPGCPANYENWQ